MQWIHNYQLFLFDFDGLLADTEQLHYQAYIDLCKEFGFDLTWTFARFSQAAHHKATGLRDHIYETFPKLYAKEPNWSLLYERKKELFAGLIQNTPVRLMPGVAHLLLALEKTNSKRCVVTHSPRSFICHIRKQNPVLDTIPHWITREDYTHPKPSPECYQTAIAKYAAPEDLIIGFEDSPRGLEALVATKATAVLVCPPDSVYLKKTRLQYPSVHFFPSLLCINNDNAP